MSGASSSAGRSSSARRWCVWAKGQPAALSPFGEKLLWAERRAQARLAPQIEALRSELERAFAIAFDDSAGVIPMYASHDDALPLLRELAQHASTSCIWTSSSPAASTRWRR